MSPRWAVPAALGALAVLMTQEGGCSKSSDGWTRALPLGSYAVAAPVCVSTGRPPAYPSPSYKVALFDFDGLTAHTLAISDTSATEVFQDSGCSVQADYGIFQDFDGIYAARHNRHFTFTPVGCTLHVIVDGATYPVGPAYSDLLKDSDDTSEEIPFSVAQSGATTTLTSQDTPQLDQLWGSYGCASPDQVRLNLSPPPVN